MHFITQWNLILTLTLVVCVGESVQTVCEECTSFSGCTAQCNKTDTEDSVCLLNGVHSECFIFAAGGRNHCACKEPLLGI